MAEISEEDKKRLEALSKVIIPDISKMIDISAIRSMTVAMEPYRKLMEQQSIQLRVLTAPMLDQLKLINTSFITQIAEQHVERMKLITESLTKSISPILETLKNVDFESFEKYYEEFGWIESISIAYANELQKKLKEQGHDEVWNQSLKDITEDGVIKKLNKDISKNVLLSKRQKILSRALERHKNKDYISSIPLLLSQIEGTFWDLGIALKKIKNEPNSTILLDKKGEMQLWEDGKYKGKPKKAKLSDLLLLIFEKDSKFKEHAEGKVYGDFRNPIFHGRNVEYDDEKRSAMLILMVHVLLNKVQEDVK